LDPVKLCMLAPEFLPVWGGVGTYIVELLRHLPKDIEIHVLTPMRESIGTEKASSRQYDFSEYFGSNVHIHFVCTANDTFMYNARFQYACSQYVPRIAREENIDLVHSHTAHMPDFLLQFKRLKIPIVTTIHTTIRGQRLGTKSSGMTFSALEFSEKLTYVTYPFLSLIETLYFLKRRYYITVSRWMKQQIIKQYPRINPSSISMIHNSVDTQLFSPGQKNHSERDIVLFTGRLVAAKGLNYLVGAIPKVLKEHPDTYFLFIGAGNSLPYQKRLIEMGISEKNYKFLGYLKDSNALVKYYRAASVYVAPTLYENLPIRVLEAMACGAPVVASNVCAIPEIIDDGVNGALVQPRSIEELYSAISCLLADVRLRNKIGNNARKTVVENFNLTASVLRTTEVYQKILENT
jgi:glycosyltransferase involved in cell wall biosynthesis